ncbi:MAG: hypothetical protein NVSMB40_06940 [Aquirhabdus sp.]
MCRQCIQYASQDIYPRSNLAAIRAQLCRNTNGVNVQPVVIIVSALHTFYMNNVVIIADLP